MNPFRFRLEKVLEWRRLQLEQEEARFRRQSALLAEIDRSRADLEAAGVHTEAQVRQWNPVEGRDLAALGAYRVEIRRQQDRMAEARREAVRQLADQQQKLLEAQRRCRLLERLKERRLAEWREGFDRELQELASESFLARWNRERSI
jgi:hypothetical protein